MKPVSFISFIIGGKKNKHKLWEIWNEQILNSWRHLLAVVNGVIRSHYENRNIKEKKSYKNHMKFLLLKVSFLLLLFFCKKN